MTHPAIQDRRRSERGSALALTIFILAVLTAMGLALMLMSEGELKSNRANLRATRSFYVAEAGLDHARMTLFASSGSGGFDGDLHAASGGAAGNDKIDFDVDALVPKFDVAGRLIGFSAGVGDDVALVPVTPFGDGGYAAFLTNDPIDAISNTTDGNGRVMVTAVGSGPDRSIEVVQAIMEYRAVLISAPPAAVTLLGPKPSYSPGDSSAKLYQGNDCAGLGKPGLFVPAVGAIGPQATQDVRDHLGKPTYESGGLPPEETIADLTDVGEPAVTTPIDADWTKCEEVRAMIENIRDVADVICTSSSCTLPPPALDRVVFVDGDFDIGPGVEAGALVVTGELTLKGNLAWDGIIFAIGEGVLLRLGGGGVGGGDKGDGGKGGGPKKGAAAEDPGTPGGTVLGAIVVADIAGPDDVYGTDDDCTGGTGGFDSAVWDTRGGGDSVVSYCLDSLNNAEPKQLYRIVDFLQR